MRCEEEEDGRGLL